LGKLECFFFLKILGVGGAIYHHFFGLKYHVASANVGWSMKMAPNTNGSQGNSIKKN